ncbi:hypothetical protein, partial [Bacillus niameyensis]|uniref:hypothetical protein n=1 Tax=Bacillus niameyensis TaxID=1522308 RepID=UPI001E3FFFFE
MSIIEDLVFVFKTFSKKDMPKKRHIFIFLIGCFCKHCCLPGQCLVDFRYSCSLSAGRAVSLLGVNACG